MIEITHPYPLAVGLRDTNRALLDYGVLMVADPSPVEPPPPPAGLRYGVWGATGDAVDGVYGSWHIEGAAVDVIYGTWS